MISNRKPFWQAAALCLLTGGWAIAGTPEEKLALVDSPSAEANTAMESPKAASESPQIADKVKDPKLRKHLMDNIDVFGKNEMPAIYILVPGAEDFEGFLLTRDFSRDEFFMQNIDREEFEMKTILRDFYSDKKDKKKDEEGR